MHERQIEHVVRETATENLFLAPAGETLAAVDIHLATRDGARARPSRILSTVGDKVDHVVIDTAPYLGLLTTNALVAAEHIVVPVSCEYLPILGLKLFGETLARMRARLGARCDVLGYLLTMYDRREKITAEVEKILRRNFGDAVFADADPRQHPPQGGAVAQARPSSSSSPRAARGAATTRSWSTACWRVWRTASKSSLQQTSAVSH